MKIVSVFGVCAALYAGAGVFLWAAQERMVFHPRPVSHEKRRALQNLEVQFAMPDGATLRGWLRPADESSPDESSADESSADESSGGESSGGESSGVGNAGCKLVVYFGGNAEEVSGNLDNPIPAKAAQLFVNYRGFGDSDGKPSANDFERDALALFDQASERFGVGAGEVCVFGRSLGTHMAAVVAAQRPVGRVVMISPFDSVLNIAKARYPIFPVRALLRHPFVTSQYAPRAKAPALFVLAESDWVVPRKRSEALIELWQAPKQVVVIPNATHNNFDSSEYRRAVSEFLNGNESE